MIWTLSHNARNSWIVFWRSKYVLDISELFSLLTLIQESYSMLNFISNLSAFVLKRFWLLYGRDKDILFRILMFVQCHAQTFLLSSTIFYHITCFKCDLCRVCCEFLKSVEGIRYNVPIKSIKSTYIIRAFLDIMSIITPEILIHHSVKAILYMMTISCSSGS